MSSVSLTLELPVIPLTRVDNSSQGRTNISPDKVPWDALRTLLTQAIYGGRIDNEFDQRLLSSFVNRLFTVSSFESDFPLVLDADGVKGKNVNMPDGIRREQFVQWTENYQTLNRHPGLDYQTMLKIIAYCSRLKMPLSYLLLSLCRTYILV
ncbi:cytoplasmic dynein 1 heavy chain 1-like [Xenia sp. Carnegie-2017]|uniref:cytoplasmic dynein 1 heavy chain 1-like n=1 Tax=Xenia sp. Carnegie-2017 TaxID=2897299 RepID=UPI001F046DEB|nr:cytoplasmic dynein 1 heavy chain 1-like [Xenia sp. Carnegie-2017]